MKTLKKNPVALAALVLCFCAAVFLALATAHADPNTIQACYNNTNGELRLVNSPSDCRKHETATSWSVAGLQGPPGPSGTAADTFRHTHTAANECTGPSSATYSVLDHASTNGNGNALIFVTAIIGITADRTNTNPNSNLLLIYTGNQTFGACPADRWLIGGGDVTLGAQYNVMVVTP